MYRVNAERSQEKNDHIEDTERCTKVICSMRARKIREVTNPISVACALVNAMIANHRGICGANTSFDIFFASLAIEQR